MKNKKKNGRSDGGISEGTEVDEGKRKRRKKILVDTRSIKPRSEIKFPLVRCYLSNPLNPLRRLPSSLSPLEVTKLRKTKHMGGKVEVRM